MLPLYSLDLAGDDDDDDPPAETTGKLRIFSRYRPYLRESVGGWLLSKYSDTVASTRAILAS
jgi:hypothetical protein